MSNISNAALLAIACVLALASGMVGGLVALWLDRPDVIATAYVVSSNNDGVAARETSAEPPPEVIAELARDYTTITGEDAQWATSLVQEMWTVVCVPGEDAGEPALELVLEHLGRDISMEGAELADFIERVRRTCDEPG